MSNSARIWIAYGITFVAFPLALVWAGLGLAAAERWPMYGAMFAIGGAALAAFHAFAAMIFYHNVARCWQCREPLFKNDGGVHMPYLTQTHCSRCGVRHAERPDEARDNPIV